MVENIPALHLREATADKKLIAAFEGLQQGTVCDIVAMVGRRWTNETPEGEYMTTEYILSDNVGNLIQCSVLREKSPVPGPELDEGSVYHIRVVLVIRNDDSYRVCKEPEYALLFLHHTTATGLAVETTGFIRHPFQFISFEDVKYIDNKYLIDVVGHIRRTADSIQGPETFAFLDCQLINGRGTVLDVTLWGKLAEHFRTKRANAPVTDSFIFTAMSVEQLDGRAYLNATMDTQIYNAADIDGCNQLTTLLGPV